MRNSYSYRVFSFFAIVLTVWAALAAHGQTNNSPFTVTATPALPAIPSNGPLSLLESYLVDNDPTYNGWTNVGVTLWQAAAFSSVSGVDGESPVGNDFGIQLPLRVFSKTGFVSNLEVDEVTRFEALFGDVAQEQIGIGYAYCLHQLKLEAGLSGRYAWQGGTVQAVPWVGLQKASTQLSGLGTFLRASAPLGGKKIGIEGEVGVEVSLGH